VPNRNVCSVLHFIDSETARVAIPFFAGQRPYANIAFQFSHHVVEANGCVEHRPQFLSTTPGRRPSYEFVRALQAALGPMGTVFMWSPHESATLNAILEELEQDAAPPPGTAELNAFIRSLTTRKAGKCDTATGSRALVDLCRLAEKAPFQPVTKGSNSIKKVLPGVMQASDYLKQRYSQPIYGAKGDQEGTLQDASSKKAWLHESLGLGFSHADIATCCVATPSSFLHAGGAQGG
jgi:hypothetical protein